MSEQVFIPFLEVLHRLSAFLVILQLTRCLWRCLDHLLQDPGVIDTLGQVLYILALLIFIVRETIFIFIVINVVSESLQLHFLLDLLVYLSLFVNNELSLGDILVESLDLVGTLHFDLLLV